jgi:hypothetical protein
MYGIVTKLKCVPMSSLADLIIRLFSAKSPQRRETFRITDAIACFRAWTKEADRDIANGVIHYERNKKQLTLAPMDANNDIARNTAGQPIGLKIAFNSLDATLEKAFENGDVAFVPAQDFTATQPGAAAQAPPPSLRGTCASVLNAMSDINARSEQDYLSYRDAVGFFVQHMPAFPIKQGVMRLSRDGMGFVFQQVFLDQSDKIAGKAKSRQMFVRNVDPELLAVFGDGQIAFVR